MAVASPPSVRTEPWKWWITGAVKHRLLEISRSAKCLTEANQQGMRDIVTRS